MKSAESDGATAPRSPLHLVINLVVSAAVLGGCLYGYTLLGERKRPARAKPNKPNGTVVVTEALTLHEGPVTVTANGVVVPLREIRLATEVAGRIVEVSENLRAGRSVTKGETLIRLDTTEYELEVRRLRAQQAQESAELAATDVMIENTQQLMSLADEQLRLATDERDRVAALVKRQAASVSEVDVTKRSELTAKSSLVELENRRRELVAGRELIVKKQALSEVALQRAQLDLARCVVTSPISGRVVMSAVEEQSFVAAGTSFVTIEDTSAVEVRSNLTVDQMYRVWNSTSGAIQLPHEFVNEELGSPDDTREDRLPPVPATIEYRLGTRTYQWQGVLERIDGAGIDPATRTYPCLFRVDAPEQVSRPDIAGVTSTLSLVDGPKRLIRGMFVTVLLKAESRRQLVRCSEMAIRPGNRIWLDVDGKMRIVPVEIVGRIGDRVVIDAEPIFSRGLTADAAVVLSPVSNPAEGMTLLSEGKSKKDVATGKPSAKTEKAAG